MDCQHLTSLTIENLISKANYPIFRCEECVRINGCWVHLRICQTCSRMLLKSCQPLEQLIPEAHQVA